MTSRASLGQKSLSLLMGAWLAALLNLVAGVFVARVLGPAAVGSLSFSLGLSGLAMAALVPGFAQAHMKRVAEGVDPGVCASTFGLIKVLDLEEDDQAGINNVSIEISGDHAFGYLRSEIGVHRLVPGQPLPELAWSELRYEAYCFVKALNP